MIWPRYKIFLFILVAFIVGVAIASFIIIDLFLCYVAFLVVLLIVFFFWSNKKIRLIGLIFIFIIFGLVRYNLSWSKSTPDKIQFYNNQKVRAVGLVINIANKIDKTEIILSSEKLIQADQANQVKGKILIYAPLYNDYQVGDQLEINCQLSQPAPLNNFAYHEYLAKQNIYSTCFPKEIKILEKNKGSFLNRLIFQARSKIKTTIERTMPEPESSIFSTLLLGIGKETPQPVRQWFSQTGTAHILSISGLHVAILTGLLIYLGINFFGLARPKAFYFVAVVLIFYILLVGAPAAAVRSVIMGLTLILGQKIGRKSNSLNLIILTAAVMLFFNPKLLKSDLGFQLSFSAILGIALTQEYFMHVFGFLKFLPEKVQIIKTYLATTFSAYLFSLPLVLFYFGNLSLSAPLANILILPVLPCLMILGFVFAIIALIFFPLAQILAWPVWLILKYIVLAVKYLSAIPYLSFNFGLISWWLVCLLYGALFFWVSQMSKKLKNYEANK